jgi:quercetin dioxygenase-like cupin family protein
MTCKLTRLSAVSLTLFLFACSGPESEPVPEAAAPEEVPVADEAVSMPASEESGSKDPTVLDPDRYSVALENDAVRVLRISYGPGEESVMHYHPNSVAVFLDDLAGQMILPDGSVVDVTTAAGDVMYSPAGEHQPKNNSDSGWEVIEVELKSREASPSDSSGPDSTVVDPEHYAIEFENDLVRVLRINYGVGEESVMHYHPDSVAVMLTDQVVEMTMPDGTTAEATFAARDIMYLPAGQHLPKSVADFDWELILVELKQ